MRNINIIIIIIIIIIKSGVILSKLTETKLRFFRQSKVFTQQADNRIGRKYKKAMYRAYTDDTFTTEIERDSDTKHLGIMGPIIYAEVGDTIEVVFKNNATRHYSIHPHGVFYM